MSYPVIVDLISATTTKTNLTVHCELDDAAYPKGIAVSDEEMDAINVVRHEFHGERNYTIRSGNRSDRAVDSWRVLRVSQVAAVSQHLTMHDRAAIALEKALKKMVAGYKQTVESGEKARNAMPQDTRPQTGMLLAYGELVPLVQEEMFRLGGMIDGKGTFSIPSAPVTDLRNMNNPQAIDSLVEKLPIYVPCIRRLQAVHQRMYLLNPPEAQHRREVRRELPGRHQCRDVPRCR